MRHRPDSTPIRLAGAVSAALLACAAPALARPPGSPTLVGAATQPLRDLNLVRPKVAQPLQDARAAPYAVADLGACETIGAEIADLDAVLGPDVDADAQKGPSMVKTLAASAVSGAVKLPFRGVVRRITGAEARDRVRDQSVAAGMARRAFLKGVSLSRCHADDTPYLDIAAAAAPAQPAPVLVAQAPRLDDAPVLRAADYQDEPAPQAGEPVYVWVASDPQGGR
jgi:hypothetical protein